MRLFIFFTISFMSLSIEAQQSTHPFHAKPIGPIGELQLNHPLLNASCMMLVSYSEPFCVQRAIANGADVNVVGEHGERPLHVASAWGNAKAVQSLITAGADVSARANDGSTALHWAGAWGSPAIIRTLIEAGADKEARAARANETALHWAGAWGEDVRTIQALIDAGVAVDIMALNNETPLVWAATLEHNIETGPSFDKCWCRCEYRNNIWWDNTFWYNSSFSW